MGYISTCDGNEVNIYDGHTARIVVSEAAVLKGWRCPQSKLWRVPLQSHVTDLNMHTLLLDGPTGCESLNSLYTVPSSAAMLDHIELFTSNPHRPNPTEAINNVYKLPSIEKAVRYLHGAAGFSTKATWLKSIHNGNYLSWHLANVRNVNNFVPESEETQEGHMHNQRQGVHSTKPMRQSTPFLPAPAEELIDKKLSLECRTSVNAAQSCNEIASVPAIERKKDISIATYNPRETMFTNQTGKFLWSFSQGNNYRTVIHEIDGDSTWVEPMKNRTEGEMILA